MYSAQMKVRRFHEVFGCKRQDKPGHLGGKEQILRLQLIREELEELDSAMAAFDMEAACSGFIYGLEIAQQFIMSRTYDTVLVIGAEKLSSIVNWKDRHFPSE